MALFLFVRRIAKKANRALNASAEDARDCDMPDAAEPDTIPPSSDTGSKPESRPDENGTLAKGPMDAAAFGAMMLQQYLERYSELTHSDMHPTDTEGDTSPSAKKRKRDDEDVGFPPTQYDDDEHESKKRKTDFSVHREHLIKARTALKVLEFKHARARKRKPRKIKVDKSHEHRGSREGQSKSPPPEVSMGSMALPYRPGSKVRWAGQPATQRKEGDGQ